jgi:hypothetical protein
VGRKRLTGGGLTGAPWGRKGGGAALKRRGVAAVFLRAAPVRVAAPPRRCQSNVVVTHRSVAHSTILRPATHVMHCLPLSSRPVAGCGFVVVYLVQIETHSHKAHAAAPRVLGQSGPAASLCVEECAAVLQRAGACPAVRARRDGGVGVPRSHVRCTLFFRLTP